MTTEILSKLAIHGGEPVRTDPFPDWPKPTARMKEQLINTFENEAWGIGSQVVKDFEEAFANFHDSKFALSVNSGTAALWVALKAAGVKAEDEVIVPAYTFVATASAVLMANAIPVFADIDNETLNMDPEIVESLITDKTRVILPVHIAGNPADISSLKRISDKHGIAMIEDAAQAHGAEWEGRKVGSFGLGGIFSFQSSKNMSAGEGGIIVTDHQDFMDRCFSYQNVGRVRNGQWYEHDHLGGNFRLSAFPASLLLAQIDSLEDDMNLRDKNADILNRELRKIEGLTCINQSPQTTKKSHHLFIILYDSEKFNHSTREEFIKGLSAEGIPAYTGYKPLYRENLFITNTREYPWLEGTDFSKLHLPVTEKTCEAAIWLKQNCLLGSEEDTMDIIRAIKKVTNYYS